jgi:oligopeptide/dipeptide ABC transporter ATP-binding protein
VPSPRHVEAGCVFAPRCTMAEAACRERVPPLAQISLARQSACRRQGELA